MVKLVPVDTQPRKLRLVPVGEMSDDDINQRVAQAHDAANTDPNLGLGEDLYERGAILPFVKNKLTGETSVGLSEMMKGGVEAAKLPGEVYAGKTPIRTADGNINPEVVKRSFDLAAFSPAGTFVAKSAKAVNQAVKSAQNNLDEAGEFGIGLSRGQATGRFKDQAFEQDALTGGRGSGAQSVMEAQRKAQQGQIESAANRITDGISPSQTDDAFQAADNISTALQERASGLRNTSDELYKSAESAQAELDPASITGLSNSLRGALDNAGAMEGAVVASEYPTAARALKRVETLMDKAPNGKVVGVGWQNVERVRRMLLNKGSGPDEGRVLGEMRKSFDDWIENSVHDALVSGDPKFLDDLKGAREAWRQYKQITGNKSAIIRKMADGSANSEQIANWLYGASKVGGRTDSSNTLREIKSLIGENHPAIDDLKRGVTMRLFQDRNGEVKSAGKLSSDIMDFVNNKGHELAKELYGDDNLSHLRRFASVLKKTIPNPNATNPSKSGHTVTRQVWDGLMNLGPVLGLASSGFTGMIAGFGIKTAANRVSRSAASKMVNKPVPAQAALPDQRGIAIPAMRGSLLSLQNDSAPIPALPSSLVRH